MKRLLAFAMVALVALMAASAASAADLSMTEAKKAAKNYALTYNAGGGVQITKVTCKRLSGSKVKCLVTFREPELCYAPSVVSKRANGKLVTKGSEIVCPRPGPDGSMPAPPKL